MIPVIPAPFFTYSNKELTFDNSLFIFFLHIVVIINNIFFLEMFACEVSSLSLFSDPCQTR